MRLIRRPSLLARVRPTVPGPAEETVPARATSEAAPVRATAEAPLARDSDIPLPPPGGLRAARVRLALVVVAAIILPLTVAAPVLVRQAQLAAATGGAADAATARQRLDQALGSVRTALLEVSASGDLEGAEAGDTAAKSRLGDDLAAVGLAGAGVVTGAWALDTGGAPYATSRPLGSTWDSMPILQADARTIASASATAMNGAGSSAGRTVLVELREGEQPVVYLAAPANGGAIVARVSLPALVAAAETGLLGRVVVAVGPDSEGQVLLSASAGAGRPDAADRLLLATPGFEAWSVGVVPRPIPFDPPDAILALIALIALFGLAIVVRLARDVLRPAATLDEAGARLREQVAAARSASLHDALTGLGNHRAFMEEFDRQMEASRRYASPVSLMLIDLDDFKLVNDSAGHAVGDELLVEFGRIMHSVLRKTDLAFRVGGDEFAVLMPHTAAQAALAIGRRLLAACTEPRRESRFPRPFAFTAGISSCPEMGLIRSELFAQADAALYDGKRHGRTTVEVFDPSRSTTKIDQQTRAELSSKVAKVVSSRALRPVYQPVVDLRTGKVVGFEGLVRPTDGFDNPGALFLAAEAGGRTTELDFACIETVLDGAAALGPGQSLSINLSPRSLEAAEFHPGELLKLLARHRMEPRRVTIELTEREVVEDVERLRAVITGCQNVGFRIAADDVGAGNAGLRLLSQIHFDIVKIDLSLVQEGEQRDTSLAVLRALTELAARWGAMVVAEGIETASQLWVVQELGMSAAQGYLLGRPMPEPTARFVDIGALLAEADTDLPLVNPGLFPTLG